jgi:hypothetical protein
MHTTPSHFFACTADPAQSTVSVYAYARGSRTNLLFRTVSAYAHSIGFVTAFDGTVDGEFRVRVLVPCPALSRALIPHFEAINMLVASARVAREVARLSHEIEGKQTAAAALA